jgi:hypothetical protein
VTKFRVASDLGPRKDRNIQNVNVHGIVSFYFRGCVNFPKEYNIVARLSFYAIFWVQKQISRMTKLIVRRWLHALTVLHIFMRKRLRTVGKSSSDSGSQLGKFSENHDRI